MGISMKKTDKLIVTDYQIKGRGQPELRIALVSDLHDRPGGEVLDLLYQQKPDLILVAGDLMERHEPGYVDWTEQEMNDWQGLTLKNRICSKTVKFFDSILPLGQKKDCDESNGRNFLKKASSIAPIFYGIGNHEWYFTDEDKKIIDDCRVTVLDNEDTAVRLSGGRTIRIGGLSTRYDLTWLQEFAEKPGYKILICHHPEYYERFILGELEEKIQLIVSGHAHGGQWRIAGRGVLAPGQGFFPKYAHGMFDAKLIVSAGLSNTANIPRFGNPRELVIIHCNPDALSFRLDE